MYVGNREVLGLKELGNTVSSRGGIVSTNCNQKFYVVVLEELQIEILVEIFLCRLETAHDKKGTSAVEDVVCLEEIQLHIIRVRGEKPLISAMKAQYTISVAYESLCYTAYYSIHSRGRTATGEDHDRFLHNSITLNRGQMYHFSIDHTYFY